MLFIFGHYITMFHAFIANPQSMGSAESKATFPQPFPPEQFFMMFRVFYVVLRALRSWAQAY